jgi:hypothetical protein
MRNSISPKTKCKLSDTFAVIGFAAGDRRSRWATNFVKGWQSFLMARYTTNDAARFPDRAAQVSRENGSVRRQSASSIRWSLAFVSRSRPGGVPASPTTGPQRNLMT